MDCDTCREAISARLDAEAPAAPAELVDAHLRACPACRRWGEAATELHRATRVRPAEWAPDLTAPILARIDAEDKPVSRPARLADIRVGLAVIALLQLLLAVPPLLGAEAGASVHVARELGSFDVALAVGLLVCAWQPVRASGLLPVVGALAVCLVATAVLDVASGRAPALSESHHLLDLVGLALVWLAARAGARGPGGGGRLGRAVLGR